MIQLKYIWKENFPTKAKAEKRNLKKKLHRLVFTTEYIFILYHSSRCSKKLTNNTI